MKTFLLILACCVLYINCAVFMEITKVSDTEKAEGYACKSKILGLLRANEERNKYEPKVCGRAICRANGIVDYATCGVVHAPDCKIIQDMSKTYPECCPKPDCSHQV